MDRRFLLSRYAGLVLAVVLVAGASAAMLACNRAGESRTDTTTTAAAQSAAGSIAVSPVTLRGTVVSASPTTLVLQADTAVITVTLAQPFHVYERTPSDLSRITESTFIGVTTVKQPDGSERATEIHLFPEELRGLGEGSRMMTPDTSSVAKRMTNGSVSAAGMTGLAPSRMSNGSVSRISGSSLVVRYAGGEQTVTVPPNTPVTQFTPVSRNLAPGEQVAVVATKGPDGSLTAEKVLSTAK